MSLGKAGSSWRCKPSKGDAIDLVERLIGHLELPIGRGATDRTIGASVLRKEHTRNGGCVCSAKA